MYKNGGQNEVKRVAPPMDVYVLETLIFIFKKEASISCYFSAFILKSDSQFLLLSFYIIFVFVHKPTNHDNFVDFLFLLVRLQNLDKSLFIQSAHDWFSHVQCLNPNNPTYNRNIEFYLALGFKGASRLSSISIVNML